MWCTGMGMVAERPVASDLSRRFGAFRDKGLWENAIGQAEMFLWTASPLVELAAPASCPACAASANP